MNINFTSVLPYFVHFKWILYLADTHLQSFAKCIRKHKLCFTVHEMLSVQYDIHIINHHLKSIILCIYQCNSISYEDIMIFIKSKFSMLIWKNISSLPESYITVQNPPRYMEIPKMKHFLKRNMEQKYKYYFNYNKIRKSFMTCKVKH